MSFITRQLIHELTYWGGEPTQPFDEFGDPILTLPHLITGRYEDKTERFLNKKGDQDMSNAIVYTQTAVEVGGYIYHGESYDSDPESVSGTHQIRRVDKCPDISNRITLYKVFL